MQKVWLTAALAIGLVGATASAEETTGAAPPPAAAPSASPPVEVYGDFPSSVAGTWLIVVNTDIGKDLSNGKDRGKDRYMSAWHVYRLAVQDKHWQLHELDRAKAPEAFGQSVVKANAEATKFQPTAESVKALTATLPQLREMPGEDTYTKVVLRTADQFEKQQPKMPAYLQGAQFSIEILERPQEGQSRSGVGYYAKDIAGDRISGTSQTAVVAVGGGGVVPFAAEGRFTMYRLQ